MDTSFSSSSSSTTAARQKTLHSKIIHGGLYFKTIGGNNWGCSFNCSSILFHGFHSFFINAHFIYGRLGARIQLVLFFCFGSVDFLLKRQHIGSTEVQYQGLICYQVILLTFWEKMKKLGRPSFRPKCFNSWHPATAFRKKANPQIVIWRKTEQNITYQTSSSVSKLSLLCP